MLQSVLSYTDTGTMPVFYMSLENNIVTSVLRSLFGPFLNMTLIVRCGFIYICL